ncbi:AraC family transcriptional regulator [Vibrio algarum]|uniref:Helix-turn-helix transcriptional regulator n=1 Tax=Vibrio algarum TaxID=3020714 RepID=A0ABT4YUQ6_9VIBR|nr:helix-turn-helix domain-containing protein [Vibrio sp. KJ40-1]MDB1125281.1 helix-turn-helix transcriptional regulator [Vibrio sp. KJ40-1]
MIQNKIISSGRSFSALNIQGHEPNGIWDPHRHDYYEIMWCLEGKGQHSIDFSTFKLRTNRVFLISPHQVHDARQLDSCLRVVAFKSDLFEVSQRHNEVMKKLGFDNVFQQPFLDLDEDGVSHLTSLWELLLVADEDNDLGLIESLLSSYLRILARYRISEHNEGAPSSRDQRIEKIESLIENNYIQQKRCEFYADAVNLTPKRINELMRAACGKTVTRSIIDRICLEAKRELTFSSKSVQKIAIELGYDDSSYFSRLFKKQAGLSPSDYRTKMFK